MVIAGPVIGLVIVTLIALANKRFGVAGGVTDLVHGSSEGRGLRSWRIGMVLGGAGYALLAGAPDAGLAYSWLDAHLSWAAEAGVLFAAGLLIGVGARTAGGCTSGHEAVIWDEAGASAPPPRSSARAACLRSHEGL